MFIIATSLSRSFLRIVKHSSIHRLQFDFVNIFIGPISFSSFNTLDVIYLRRYVRDVVVLKCCTKWAENESDFYPFLSRRRILEEQKISNTNDTNPFVMVTTKRSAYYYHMISNNNFRIILVSLILFHKHTFPSTFGVAMTTI